MDAGPSKRQRGAEIVEFLLVVPFMLIVFLLIIELGVGFANQAVLANAARAGARAAIKCDGNPTQNPCLQSAKDAADQAALSIISLKDKDNAPGPLQIQLGSVEACNIGSTDPPAGGCPITAIYPYQFQFFLLPAFLPGIADFQQAGRVIMSKLPD